MKAAQIIAGMIAVFIQMPIWFYLIYKLLQASNASELMWFLFWIYVPVVIFTSIVAKMTEKKA